MCLNHFCGCHILYRCLQIFYVFKWMEVFFSGHISLILFFSVYPTSNRFSRFISLELQVLTLYIKTCFQFIFLYFSRSFPVDFFKEFIFLKNRSIKQVYYFLTSINSLFHQKYFKEKTCHKNPTAAGWQNVYQWHICYIS